MIMREQPEIYDIRFIKGFVRRRKRLFIFVFSLIFIGSIIVAFALPKYYISTATILIEGQVPEDLAKAVSSGYVEERLQTIKQQILSHDKLLEIIRQYGLYGSLESQADVENAVQKMREDVLIRTIKVEDLDQRPSRARYNTVAFTLSYEGKDPVITQKVASKLTSLFIEKNVQTKDQIATQTAAVFEKKLSQHKEKTDVLQTRLESFKRVHAGELPESTAFNVEQIFRLTSQLDEVNAKIKSLEDRKANLVNPLPAGSAQAAAAGVQTDSDPWTRLSQLRSQHLSLQSRYSDKHPDVIKIKNDISKLEARLESSGDPLSTDMKRYQKQREEIQARIADFQRKNQMAPFVQREYSKLVMDYEAAMNQFNDTQNKLNEVKVAKGLEETQLGERFTISDEPQVPAKPDKPKRGRIMLAGFLLSILLGVSSSIVVERFDHSIKSVEELQKVAKSPVLIVFPLIKTEEEIAAERGRNKIAAFFEELKRDTFGAVIKSKKS